MSQFRIRAEVRKHPRLDNAVEVQVYKGSEPAGHKSVVEHSMELSIDKAKQMVRMLYPDVAEGDICVLV